MVGVLDILLELLTVAWMDRAMDYKWANRLDYLTVKLLADETV
jgi:hypothetical protein